MSVNWTTPKTNWQVSYDEYGAYTGDYFEVEDYNRIKNNTDCIKDLFDQIYAKYITYLDLGDDVQLGDEEGLFASIITKIQTDIQNLNLASYNLDIGTAVNFYSNAAGDLKDELNRIENAQLQLYTSLNWQKDNKQRISYRLGNWRGAIR